MEKQYKDMTTDEKAQAIYNRLKDQSLTTLSELLMNLSGEYSNEVIFTMDDWLEYEKETDLAELIKIAQASKGLNVNDDYIRESIYYYGYKTANSVLELVDEDEAVDWIASALMENNITVGQVDNMMENE